MREKKPWKQEKLNLSTRNNYIYINLDMYIRKKKDEAGNPLLYTHTHTRTHTPDGMYLKTSLNQSHTLHTNKKEMIIKTTNNNSLLKAKRFLFVGIYYGIYQSSRICNPLYNVFGVQCWFSEANRKHM